MVAQYGVGFEGSKELMRIEMEEMLGRDETVFILNDCHILNYVTAAFSGSEDPESSSSYMMSSLHHTESDGAADGIVGSAC